MKIVIPIDRKRDQPPLILRGGDDFLEAGELGLQEWLNRGLNVLAERDKYNGVRVVRNQR